ncbi:MAG TPA: helix-hairpin-helix domain-containing protein [Thermoplasmata archaeon]|nr:helix-hairpin-helix domain-containing protein [Thermoplasmata archaeon]
MPTNAEAADQLREIADLLDLTGERFKPEAYRRAARSVESLTEPLAAVAGRGGLREIPGVGEAIAEKLTEFLAAGRIPYLDRLRAEIPSGLLALMRLPGLGPKTARRFWQELGIEGPAELGDAIAAGRLVGVAGFGPKKIEQIRAALAAAPTAGAGRRFPIEEVYPLARGIVDALRAGAPTERVELAGSFRRGRETVGDLDVLVTSDAPEKVFDVFSALPEVREIRMRGGTKETVVLRTGLQVDLRVVEPAAFGAALQYFTGSKDHNVRLRTLARDAGLKINEYGVFRGDERVAGATEEDVYDRMAVPWIPPELREDGHEIDAARAGTLPTPVEASDLVAELHLHLPPTADAAAIARIGADAGRRGVGDVGVVVAAAAEPGGPIVRADRLAELLTADRSIRWHLAAEVAVGASPPTGTGVEYVIVRPAAAVAPPASSALGSLPARLVAHVGGDLMTARPWIDLARSRGVPIEVGPGPDRADSTVARAALAAGVDLAVPTGVGLPERDPLGPIALAFARRAGAAKARVTNARPWPATTTERRRR